MRGRRGGAGGPGWKAATVAVLRTLLAEGHPSRCERDPGAMALEVFFDILKLRRVLRREVANVTLDPIGGRSCPGGGRKQGWVDGEVPVSNGTVALVASHMLRLGSATAAVRGGGSKSVKPSQTGQG